MPQQRKSDHTHWLQNTRPHDRTPEGAQSSVPGGRPEKIPADVRRSLFKSICRELELRGHLSSGDSELVRLLCFSLDRHAKAEAHLKKSGEVIIVTRCSPTGNEYQAEIVSPWLKIASEAHKQAVGILDRLGLSPISRDKVKIVLQAEPKLSTADRITLGSDED